MHRLRIEREDGRYVCLYADGAPPVPIAGPSLERGPAQIELRWDPILDEQVIVSTVRQERTFLPRAEHCPLCPSAQRSVNNRQQSDVVTEIPAADFEVAVFENRFPSFRPDAPDVNDESPLERRAAAHGVCEVIVYTPDHDATLASLDRERMRLLVDVWADRYRELGARAEVAYVFIFENRGREIGVTLTHPHGQVYAFPFVPPRVEREHAAARRHAERAGGCLHCAVVGEERRDGRRIVAEAEGFVAYVPFAARLPYELHVAATEHRASLLELNDRERRGLAQMLQEVQGTYDALWGFAMPYTMSMHQATTDGEERHWEHLHVEFVPPYRTADKLKYLAGVETGTGTFINDTSPEEKAAELREAGARWRGGG